MNSFLTNWNIEKYKKIISWSYRPQEMNDRDMKISFFLLFCAFLLWLFMTRHYFSLFSLFCTLLSLWMLNEIEKRRENLLNEIKFSDKTYLKIHSRGVIQTWQILGNWLEKSNCSVGRECPGDLRVFISLWTRKNNLMSLIRVVFLWKFPEYLCIWIILCIYDRNFISFKKFDHAKKIKMSNKIS